MLRNKVFGAYESDLEFQLVHFASMPLYKEVFDADAALRSSLATVYVAESHSESTTLATLRMCESSSEADDLYSETEKYFDYTKDLSLITAQTLVVVGDQDWICPPGRSISSQ